MADVLPLWRQRRPERRWRMILLPREEGQGLAEYGMVIVLVAIVIVAILMLLGPIVGDMFSSVVQGF
ncbi:MAG: Flp family type IVb pilin [Anaerolineae bacterium]|nr:Flp family type IVb pilin [Anaerolineae bacterium]